MRNLEKVIEVCKNASIQIKDPEELKTVQHLLRRTKKDLWTLKNKTPNVLKNAEAMQKNLDSMTWIFIECGEVGVWNSVLQLDNAI